MNGGLIVFFNAFAVTLFGLVAEYRTKCQPICVALFQLIGVLVGFFDVDLLDFVCLLTSSGECKPPGRLVLAVLAIGTATFRRQLFKIGIETFPRQLSKKLL